MKASIQHLSRLVALGALAAGLSSCSLFKNGKYANQWEIESDVPASLNSGEATAHPASSEIASNVHSDLSGTAHLDPADTTSLDLPTSEESGMVEVPKPDLALVHEAREVGQSPVEMLSLPPVSPENDLPAASAGTYDNNSLLASPPPVVTEEELAGVPAALAPIPAAPDSPAAATPASTAPVPGTTPDPLGKEPAAAGSTTVIPLLYGKLDLTPYLNTPPASSPPAPPASLAGP